MEKNIKSVLGKIALAFILIAVCIESGRLIVKDIPADLAEQLPHAINYNVHKFVLDKRLGYLSPVVRWNLNGDELYMMVDTGSIDNGLFKNGMRKAIFEYKVTDLLKQNKYKFSAKLEDREYILDPYGIFRGEPKKQLIDGWLGLSWMKFYDDILIDYVNNRIRYNQPPISDYDIPMCWNDKAENKYTIPFTLNGKEMYGIIDTSSSLTWINTENLAGKEDKNGLYTVNDFSIGDVSYREMEVSSINVVFDAEDSEKESVQNNVLGYSCFKDHVIQLDFKNNVFRIK